MSDNNPIQSSGDGLDAPDRRNELAMIRTDLANERTFLSYGRTSLMLAGTGGTIIKIFDDSRNMLALGFVLLGLGAIMFVIGIWRFRLHQKRIHPYL